MAGNQQNKPHVISRSALRGALWLLPLLAVISILAYNARKPQSTNNKTISDTTKTEPRDNYRNRQSDGDIEAVERFTFDPNTVSYMELRRLGLSKNCAASIIKYRERGKVFSIKEDFAVCYGLSDKDYVRLEPLIVIGEKHRLKPTILSREEIANNSTTVTNRRDTLFGFDPNKIGREEFVRLGFSTRQWEVFDKYRTMVGRFETPEEFGKCYVVGSEKLATLLPYITIAKPTAAELIELNSADSATLCTVQGIGAVTAKRIIDYGRRLGGYHCAEQLCEVEGVSERNFEKIYQQIWVDSCVIRKIDINFAPAKQLVEALSHHPYAGGVVVRKLLKTRQLKGGWRTIGELENDDILSTRQAEQLARYLLFRPANH